MVKERQRKMSEIIEKTAKDICNALNALVSENTPMPEFRAAWLKSNEKIASRYSSGLITKSEMKAEYQKAKDNLVMLAFLIFLKDDNAISNEIKHEIYEKCKRRALAA